MADLGAILGGAARGGITGMEMAVRLQDARRQQELFEAQRPAMEMQQQQAAAQQEMLNQPATLRDVVPGFDLLPVETQQHITGYLNRFGVDPEKPITGHQWRGLAAAAESDQEFMNGIYESRIQNVQNNMLSLAEKYRNLMDQGKVDQANALLPQMDALRKMQAGLRGDFDGFLAEYDARRSAALSAELHQQYGGGRGGGSAWRPGSPQYVRNVAIQEVMAKNGYTSVDQMGTGDWREVDQLTAGPAELSAAEQRLQYDMFRDQTIEDPRAEAAQARATRESLIDEAETLYPQPRAGSDTNAEARRAYYEQRLVEEGLAPPVPSPTTEQPVIPTWTEYQGQ
jgi:soluble cytochrome b562